MQIMCVDYGFRSGNMRLYQEEYGSVPSNVFSLVPPLHPTSRLPSKSSRPPPPLSGMTRLPGVQRRCGSGVRALECL